MRGCSVSEYPVETSMLTGYHTYLQILGYVCLYAGYACLQIHAWVRTSGHLLKREIPRYIGCVGYAGISNHIKVRRVMHLPIPGCQGCWGCQYFPCPKTGILGWIEAPNTTRIPGHETSKYPGT